MLPVYVAAMESCDGLFTNIISLYSDDNIVIEGMATYSHDGITEDIKMSFGETLRFWKKTILNILKKIWEYFKKKYQDFLAWWKLTRGNDKRKKRTKVELINDLDNLKQQYQDLAKEYNEFILNANAAVDDLEGDFDQERWRLKSRIRDLNGENGKKDRTIKDLEAQINALKREKIEAEARLRAQITTEKEDKKGIMKNTSSFMKKLREEQTKLKRNNEKIQLAIQKLDGASKLFETYDYINLQGKGENLQNLVTDYIIKIQYLVRTLNDTRSPEAWANDQFLNKMTNDINELSNDRILIEDLIKEIKTAIDSDETKSTYTQDVLDRYIKNLKGELFNFFQTKEAVDQVAQRLAGIRMDLSEIYYQTNKEITELGDGDDANKLKKKTNYLLRVTSEATEIISVIRSFT